MARIHARVIEGEFVYRPYSGILKEYRGGPMTKEEIKKWFEENCFSVTEEAEKDGFLKNRIAIAERYGDSSPTEQHVDLHSGWLGEKKPTRKSRSNKFNSADKKWLKLVMKISPD